MLQAKRRNNKYQNIKNGEKQRDMVLISKWKKRSDIHDLSNILLSVIAT
jgi:hypothetical protein